ncbi:uncharacterized protein LOC144166627 [Haemaphysalis longicornis]
MHQLAYQQVLLNYRLLAQVVIYFKTLTFENVAAVPKYNLDRVLSSFCGINGMYLGGSFLLFFSLLEASLVACWSYCKARCRRPAKAIVAVY